MDNTQFAQMMVALDNTVAIVSGISYQFDIVVGLLFALVFITAYRWHL